MRIILDTNVLVSGVFFSGPPSAILSAWREGRVALVVSPEILDEYQRVVTDLSSRFPVSAAGPILDLIATHAEVLSAPPLPQQVCDDPEDDKFLACAIAGDVSCVVSGDQHLLRKTGYAGIEVLTPREFLGRLPQSHD